MCVVSRWRVVGAAQGLLRRGRLLWGKSGRPAWRWLSPACQGKVRMEGGRKRGLGSRVGMVT